MKPEPVFNSSRKMSESMSKPPARKAPEPVVDSPRKIPEPVSNPPARKVPEPVANSPTKMPEPVSKPPARKVSKPVSEPPSRKAPDPVSTSSALLRETGPVAITVAKEHDTDNLYPVTTVEQDIVIDARGDTPTTEPLIAALR